MINLTIYRIRPYSLNNGFLFNKISVGMQDHLFEDQKHRDCVEKT